MDFFPYSMLSILEHWSCHKKLDRLHFSAARAITYIFPDSKFCEINGDIKGEYLECKVENSLKGKPVTILCRYIANFERMVTNAKDEVERSRNR